ncbi:3'(2'),5'-bisphosphate nucleotidase [Typha angustifolia]|uniref:3'(2'),5'-bisphosphate nucleotidase n=1 Tax=Typha angustifolia TaxID=59011 RepID=UPI003C2C3267
MATRASLSALSSINNPWPLPSIYYTTKPYRLLFSCRSISSSPRLRSRRFPSPVASMPSYDKELAAAKKAASLAARLCQIVQKELGQSDVQSKADKSPVTVADYGSQALVSLVLNLELPSASFSLVAEEDSGDLRKDGAQETLKRITNLVNDTLSTDGTYNIVVSEEAVLAAIDSGKSEGGPSGQHWVLDPIDGTKGFLRGDQYAIALALLDEGRVVLGVLACPNLPLMPINSVDEQYHENPVGCLFSAKIGDGAEMQLLNGSSPTKIHVSSTENPADASFFESFEAAHSLHDLSSAIAEKLGVQAPPVRIDSQAKYGALARGDGAIYLRLPHKGYHEKIWDHAAGCIVVTEAGGVVTDAAGNNLDFSKGRFLDLDTGIIVTNRTLMPSLLNAVQEAIREKNQAASLL